MDAAVKARWVAALPEYEQCRGRLHDGEKFCCFGVLCDIELDADWIPGPRQDFDATGDTRWSISDPSDDLGISATSGVLPYSLRISTGITDSDEKHLMWMNDHGKSFKQISTWIKATCNERTRSPCSLAQHRSHPTV